MFTYATALSQAMLAAMSQVGRRHMRTRLYRSFVTFWKFICSHAGTPRWLDNDKECIQSAWSKKRDCYYVAHGISAAVVRVVFASNFMDIIRGNFKLVPEVAEKSSLNACVVLPCKNFLKFYNSKMKQDILSLLTPCDRSFLKYSSFR